MRTKNTTKNPEQDRKHKNRPKTGYTRPKNDAFFNLAKTHWNFLAISFNLISTAKTRWRRFGRTEYAKKTRNTGIGPKNHYFKNIHFWRISFNLTWARRILLHHYPPHACATYYPKNGIGRAQFIFHEGQKTSSAAHNRRHACQMVRFVMRNENQQFLVWLPEFRPPAYYVEPALKCPAARSRH